MNVQNTNQEIIDARREKLYVMVFTAVGLMGLLFLLLMIVSLIEGGFKSNNFIIAEEKETTQELIDENLEKNEIR